MFKGWIEISEDTTDKYVIVQAGKKYFVLGTALSEARTMKSLNPRVTPPWIEENGKPAHIPSHTRLSTTET